MVESGPYVHQAYYLPTYDPWDDPSSDLSIGFFHTAPPCRFMSSE